MSRTSAGDGAPNTDPDGNGQAVVVKHRFPGQYAEESGLSYNYFRDYEPATGRYIESDPLGLGDGPNTYAYVRSRPLFTFDPFGLASFTGFPPDKEQQMRDANEQALERMKSCKSCQDCGPEGQYSEYCINEAQRHLVIQGLQNAQYVYQSKPPAVRVGRDVCGLHVNEDLVHIYPKAFTGACCALSTVLAHEAGHIANLTHAQIFYFQKQCFGCDMWGSP